MRVVARMMAILLVAFSSSTSVALTFAPIEPRVVLIERNPWLMVIGSDSPTFALYSNGLVIFRKASSSEQFFSATLTTTQYRELLDQLALETLAGLKNRYALSSSTDQPNNELFTWIDGKKTEVSVYGRIGGGRDTDHGDVPPAVLRVFDTLSKFDVVAQPWLPDQIEVMLLPYENSPEAPAAWPSEWPDFSKTVKRGMGGFRAVYLPASQYNKLREVMGALGQKQAILFGGQKWSISFRLPFPAEALWML